MRRLLALAIAFALSATFPTPLATAGAQDEAPTGSRIKQKRGSRDLDKAQEGLMLDLMSSCVYRRNKAEAAKLFAASDPVSVDYGALGLVNWDRVKRAYALDQCLDDSIRRSRSSLMMGTSAHGIRLFMMEQSYLERYPAAPGWLGEEIVLPVRRYVSSPQNLELAKGMAFFADCLVMSAASEADALLRTPRRSDAAENAVRALLPHLSSCIPEGQELTLTRESIREFAIEGLFHRASYYRTEAATGEGG